MEAAPPSANQEGDEGAAVDHALNQTPNNTTPRVSRITLAWMTPPVRSYDPRPGLIWVIELANVYLPPMGVTDTAGKHAGVEIVLVDTNTLRPRYAINA